MSEFWRSPLQAALARAQRAWGGKIPPDREAPAARTFPEHVVHACLAWAHRLRIEMRGERRLRRPRQVITDCANRWKQAAGGVSEVKSGCSRQGEAIHRHAEEDDEEGRRLWIASGLSATAIFAFIAIEFGFARSALDVFLSDPTQKILGYKIENVGAVAIALAMAAASEVAARFIRGFLAVLPRWGRRLLVIAGALLLPLAFVLPFLALRTEAAELGNTSAASAVIPGLHASVKAASSGGGDPTIPFLVLGLAPVLVGAVLRAAASSPHADEGLRLRLAYARLWAVRRFREWRFARLVRRLDRAEMRLGRRLRTIARREAADEAGRIVDRIGYRLVGERWYGSLQEAPAVVEAVTHPEPGELPGGTLPELRDRYEVDLEHLSEGGPTRQKLEAEFGNPLVPVGRAAAPGPEPEAPAPETKPSSNNHREQESAERS